MPKGRRRRTPVQTVTPSNVLITERTVHTAVAAATAPILRVVERESQAMRAALAEQQPKRLGARLTVNIITLLPSTAAVVVAGASLAVAIDTSARDHLAGTFTAPMGACMRIDDGIRSITPSTVVDTVITNT